MVVYLSSLLRAVIALHALVDNKTTIGKAELEEGEKEKTKKEKEGEGEGGEGVQGEVGNKGFGRIEF
jgi:26S proteasome regulatory subunit N8